MNRTYRCQYCGKGNFKSRKCAVSMSPNPAEKGWSCGPRGWLWWHGCFATALRRRLSPSGAVLNTGNYSAIWERSSTYEWGNFGASDFGSVTSRLPSASAPSPPKPPSPSRVEPVSTSFHTNMSMEVTTDKVSAMALARYANTVLNGLTLLNQSQPPRMFMRVSKSADYRPTWIITPSWWLCPFFENWWQDRMHSTHTRSKSFLSFSSMSCWIVLLHSIHGV